MICLSRPGRGMAEGCSHPTSSVRPKGVIMPAGQFKHRICFWVQSGPGFQLNPLCPLSTCKNKSLRRSQRCPEHHIFNSCFGNWVGFPPCRSDLTSSVLCPLRAGASESTLWTWPVDCWGWLESWACTSSFPAPSRELSLRLPFAKDSCIPGQLLVRFAWWETGCSSCSCTPRGFRWWLSLVSTFAT